jgi:3-isopropylmalate dehydratase small subunit
VADDPAAELTLDLEARRLEAGGAGYPVILPESRRQVFLSGSWDTVGVLLAGLEQARAAAARLPYLTQFPYQ